MHKNIDEKIYKLTSQLKETKNPKKKEKLQTKINGLKEKKSALLKETTDKYLYTSTKQLEEMAMGAKFKSEAHGSSLLRSLISCSLCAILAGLSFPFGLMVAGAVSISLATAFICQAIGLQLDISSERKVEYAVSLELKRRKILGEAGEGKTMVKSKSKDAGVTRVMKVDRETEKAETLEEDNNLTI